MTQLQTTPLFVDSQSGKGLVKINNETKISKHMNGKFNKIKEYIEENKIGYGYEPS